MIDFAARARSPWLLLAVGFCCWFLMGSDVVGLEPLVWKFTVGETQNYRLVQKMEMTMNQGSASDVPTTIEQVLDMNWKVETVQENGNALLTEQFRRLQMDWNTPGQEGKIHYDTASKDEPQGYAAMLAPKLQTLIASKFQVTVTPRGQIVEVKFPAALREAMDGAHGSAILGDLASKEGLQNLVQQSFFPLPEADHLAPGFQWTESFAAENPTVGKLTTETTYRYEGPREKDGLEVFVPTVVVRFDGGADSTIQVAAQKSSGEILFDRSAGRLESSHVRQQIDLVITEDKQKVDEKLNQTVELQHVAAEQPAAPAGKD